MKHENTPWPLFRNRETQPVTETITWEGLCGTLTECLFKDGYLSPHGDPIPFTDGCKTKTTHAMLVEVSGPADLYKAWSRTPDIKLETTLRCRPSVPTAHASYFLCKIDGEEDMVLVQDRYECVVASGQLAITAHFQMVEVAKQ